MALQWINIATSDDTRQEIKRLSPLNIIRFNSLDCVNSPSDVVKELIENSLDAGATSVKVFYSYYGYREIVVYDNGIGISGLDNSFENIANNNCTNKIRNYDEIFSVQTYGFRGNALMWISLKGDLQIFSRGSKNAKVLRAIYVNGGLFSIVSIRTEDEAYVLRSFVGHTNIDISGRFTIMVVSNLGDSFSEADLSPSVQRSELEDTIKRYSIAHYDKDFLLYDTDLSIPILTLERRSTIQNRLFDVRRDIFASACGVGGQTEGTSKNSTGSLSHLITRSSILRISEKEILQSPFYVAIKNKRGGLRSLSAHVPPNYIGDPDIATPAYKNKAVVKVEPPLLMDSDQKEAPKRATSVPVFSASSVVYTLPLVPDILWYVDAITKKDEVAQLQLVPRLTPLLLASYSDMHASLPSITTSYERNSKQKRCQPSKIFNNHHTQYYNTASTLNISIYMNNPIIQPVPRKNSQQKILLHSLITGEPMINSNLAILLYYNKRPVILKRLFEEVHTCVNFYFKEIYGPNLIVIMIESIHGVCPCDLDRTPEKKLITFGKFIGRLLQDRIVKVLSLIFSKNLNRQRVKLSEHQRLLAKANMFGDSLDISSSTSSHALRLLGGLNGQTKVDPNKLLDFDYRLNLFFEKCTRYIYERIFEGATGGDYHSGVADLDSHAATRHINNNIIVKTIKLYYEEFKAFDPYAKANRNVSEEILNRSNPLGNNQTSAQKTSSISRNNYSPSHNYYQLDQHNSKQQQKSTQLHKLNKVTTDIMKRVLGYDFQIIRNLENPIKRNYKSMFLSTYLLYGLQYTLIKSFATMRPDLVRGFLQLTPNINYSTKEDYSNVSLSTLAAIFNSINNSPSSTKIQYSKLYNLFNYQESSDWISEADLIGRKPSKSIFALKSRHATQSLRTYQKAKKATTTTSSTDKLINSAPDVQLPKIDSPYSNVSHVPITAKSISSPLLEYLTQFNIKTTRSSYSPDECTDISEAQPHEPTRFSTSSELSRSPSLSISQRTRLKLSALTIPSDDASDIIRSIEVQENNSEVPENSNSEQCEIFNPISEAEKSIQGIIEQHDLALSSQEDSNGDTYHKLRKFTQVFSTYNIESRFHHLENHIIFILEEELREKRSIYHILRSSPREVKAIRKKQKVLSESSERRGCFTERDIKIMGRQRLDAMSDAVLTNEPMSLARMYSYVKSQKALLSKAELNTGNFINIDGTIVAYYNLDNYCCNLNAIRVTIKVFKIIFVKYWLGNAVKNLYNPSVSFHKVPLMRVPTHYNMLVETFIDLFLAMGIGVSIADNVMTSSIPSKTCIQLLIHPLLLVSEYYQCFKLLFEANKTAVPTESDFEQFLGKVQLLLFYDHLETQQSVGMKSHKALQKRLGLLNYGHPMRIEYSKDINYTIPYSNETIKSFIHYYCEFLATHFVRVAYETKSPEITKAYFRLIIDHLDIEDLDTPYKMPIYTENEILEADQTI